MQTRIMALNDSKIRAAKPLAKSYKLTDAQGLYLTVSRSGTKLWYFRYCFGGKENRLAFSAYPLVMLAEAHKKRDAARKLLASGICPALRRSARWITPLLTNPAHLNLSPLSGIPVA